MHLTRRQFIAASTASLATATLAADELGAITSPVGSSSVIHTVYFWLKRPNSEVDRNALIAGLKTLKQVPMVKSLHVGVPANTEKRDVVDNSFDVFELMFFDNLAGQSRYQQHPVHLAFVQNCAHLWDKVVVHDSLTV